MPKKSQTMAVEGAGSAPGLSQSPTISLTAAATQMGMVIGTAAYMSPEQAKGKPVDKRADAWAFGAVLFEMLTGQRAFAGGDVSETLAYVITKDVDWATLPNGTPESIQQLLRRCLERDPRQRLRDIGEARIGIEGSGTVPVAAAPEPVVVPTLQVWQRPLAALGIVVVAVLLASLAVWSLTRPGPLPADPVVRFSVPLGPEQAFTRSGRHLVALSPDGTQLVYQADQQLYLRRLDQLQATAIPGTREGDGRSPFISPDGEWVGFWAGGQLKKVAMSGGAAVTLGDVANPWGASWGADDTILVGQGPDGIWRVPGTGGTPEVVIPVEDGDQAHGPQMLPGGEWVLFTLRPAGSGSWDAAQIVVQSLVTGERVVLIEGGARCAVCGDRASGLRPERRGVRRGVRPRRPSGPRRAGAARRRRPGRSDPNGSGPLQRRPQRLAGLCPWLSGKRRCGLAGLGGPRRRRRAYSRPTASV